MNRKNAYDVGVKMALHDIGIEKTAGIGRMLGMGLGGAGLGAGTGYLAGGDAASALKGALIGGLGTLGMGTGASLAARGAPMTAKNVSRVGAGGLAGLAGGLGAGGIAANLSERGLKDKQPGPTQAQQAMYGLSPEQSQMLARQQWGQ